MRFSKSVGMTLLAGLIAVTGLWAQRPSGGMGGMNPFGSTPSFGLQNPTAGSGAEYSLTTKGKDMDLSVVILGKEDVNGAPGYWMEMRMVSQDMGGETVMKMLTVSSGADQGVKRMIMQSPGRPPMELPTMMMTMMQQHQQPPITTKGESGPAGAGQLVGEETVTVPAGTFTCQHYRKQDARGTTDLWISTQVTPWALAKMTGPDASMVLKKVLSNETSHINGEPQKINIPGMPQ
jgi:hypothetical protein